MAARRAREPVRSLGRPILGAVAAMLGAALAAREPAGAGDAARSAELLSVRTAAEAGLVAERMRAGFFMDQLLIPGARHLGRFDLADLEPALRAQLEAVPAGQPVRATSAAGALLVAQALPPQPAAVLGETRYAQDPERVRSILSIGPTNPDLLSLEVDVDGRDLAAVCRVKRALVADEVAAARAAVAGLPGSAPLPQAVSAHARLASALSFVGDMEGAIAALDGLSARLPAEGRPGSRRATLTHMLGILHLRRGEQENCVMHHGREMCLFPIRPGGRHTRGDGAQRAVDYFQRSLDWEPANLEVRWLLNVAAMTVGAYPEGVPARSLIPPDALRSKEDIGRFPDVAEAAGLARVDNAGGSVTDDFDGDFLLDVVVSSRDPCEPLRLFKNRGDGTFADVSREAGLLEQLGGLNVTQTDFDNDGRLDLFVMRGGWETAMRNSLLRNNEDGTFTDVTQAAGLSGSPQRTHSAAWGDYDNDGWLDVFVGHELSWSQLFRNRGDGTFEDVTDRAGMRFRSFVKGAAWGDIDDDGQADLYVSNFGDRNLLFRNLGNGRFEEVGRERGVSEPAFSFTTWFWDYDNDGAQDLFVATFLQTVDEVAREYLGMPPQGETLRVYRNRGGGQFEDVTAPLGLARMVPTMGANFGDLDNDGFLDFYLATGAPSYGMLVPNRMFRNQGGRSFVDVTESTGTGHLQKGHGVSFADLDQDGDLDVFANMGGAFPGDKYAKALFENPGHGNHWLAVRLVGTRANRPALGARLRVVTEENGKEEQRVRSVTGGGSFGSSPLLQHIGLGSRAKVKRLEVEWPGSRARQVIENLAADQVVEVTEGKKGYRRLERRPFRLGKGG